MQCQTGSLRRTWIIGFALLVSCHFGVAVDAQTLPSFVVTTVNHQAGVESPVAKHRIVFDQGVVYDFDELNDESITVFDTNRNRIVLLNSDLKARGLVSMDHLTKMTAEIRANVTSAKQQEQFGMSAKVQSQPGGKYSIQYGDLQYASTTQPAKTQSVARQFGQFVDWACRLNMARRLGLPPFGRMSLNSVIASNSQLPLELKLEITQQGHLTRLSSLHTVTTQLSDSDRRQIDEVAGMIALFKDVPLKELP